MDDVAKVRKRPGMYAGEIQEGTALHNLVLGMVTFAVAKARRHLAAEITVVLRVDAAATVCFTSMEEGDDAGLASFADARLRAATSVIESFQLEPDSVDIEGGVFCDLCVVNALSDWVCDQMWIGPVIQTHMFRDGIFESIGHALIISDVANTGQQGLSTTFLPSSHVFPSIDFDAPRLRKAIDELSRQNAGISVTLVDAR